METMVKSFKDFQRQIRLLRGMWGDADHVFFDKCIQLPTPKGVGLNTLS